MAKRTLQINVHMSGEDLALLRKAAAVAKWPEVTTSTLVLHLAKERAEQILHPARERKPKSIGGQANDTTALCRN